MLHCRLSLRERQRRERYHCRASSLIHTSSQ
jgi:hypothetical protein